MNPPNIPPKPEVVMPTTNTAFATPTAMPTSPLTPKRNNKLIFGILGIIILTITTIAGFFLIAKPVLFNSHAWNCGAYTFSLSPTGVISVTNGSSNSEPLQRADLYINNQLVHTYDVPALNAGGTATLGNISVPTTTFTWQVKGTSDCSNAGRVEINTSIYQCQAIKAYSADGSTAITATDLSALKSGTAVRFVAIGSGGAGNYSAARFTINGTVGADSTLKMSNGDFYVAYTIPTTTKTFSIRAQLKGKDGNWY